MSDQTLVLLARLGRKKEDAAQQIPVPEPVLLNGLIDVKTLCEIMTSNYFSVLFNVQYNKTRKNTFIFPNTTQRRTEGVNWAL